MEYFFKMSLHSVYTHYTTPNFFEGHSIWESNFLASKLVVTRVKIAIFNVVNVKTHLLRLFAQNRKSFITLVPVDPKM